MGLHIQANCTCSILLTTTNYLKTFHQRVTTSLLHVLSLIRHYDSFGRGVVAVPDLVYYGVLIGLCLLLSIRRLDAERLR